MRVLILHESHTAFRDFRAARKQGVSPSLTSRCVILKSSNGDRGTRAVGGTEVGEKAAFW